MRIAMKCSGTIGCALLSAALLAGTVSCAKKAKKTDKPVPAASATTEAATAGLKFKPTDAQHQIIDGLLTRLNRENWRFPSKDTNAPENARLFTYLAATSKDPAVIGAALTAMYGAYSSHSKRKAKPDADFVMVVNEHLATKDPKIATRALLAARTGMAGKDASPQLITTVASLASHDPYRSGPGRYAVIDALRVISATQRTPEVVKIFEQSLDSSDTYVVSYALQALYRATRSIENRDKLKGKVLGMAKHEDPGVRGRALELLGALGRDDQEVLKTVLAALSDPSPYVRSEAAQAVARLRYRPAIHAVMKLVDDKESNRYDIKNWTMLDGKPGRLHHDGSPWSRVDDAAMNAIRSLSGGELKLERVNPKEIEKTLDANVATTKAWYAKEKSKIPSLNLQSPEPQSAAAVPSGRAPGTQAPAATAKKPKTGSPPAAPKPPAPAKPAPPATSP